VEAGRDAVERLHGQVDERIAPDEEADGIDTKGSLPEVTGSTMASAAPSLPIVAVPRPARGRRRRQWPAGGRERSR
jgi:hypothetical protein